MKAQLIPQFDRAKSFYGKAIITTANGNTILTSYTTDVCYIDKAGKIHKLWNGYSATTMRHINEFLRQNNIEGGGKKWWDNLPTEEYNPIIDLIIEARKIA